MALVTRAEHPSRPSSRSPVPSVRVTRWWASLPTSTRVVLVVLPVALAAFASWGFGEVIGQHHRQFDLRLYYDAINYWQSGHDLFSYSQPDVVNVRLGFTYPPLAAVLMTPMAWLSYGLVKVVWLTGIIAATAGCVWLVLRERFAYPKQLMIALVGVGTAAAFLLEPFRQTLSFGQINVYLALLVLVDLLVLGRRGSRWTGVGIGLATALKLTPGIFIVYLLVVGRWRAALTAMAAAVGFTLLSAVVTPTETWKYFTSLMWETSRVGFLDTTMNQSINGLLARLAAPLEPRQTPWLLLAVAIAAFGFWRARRAAAAGDELAAVTLAGLIGILVSPVSWVHHAVWILPAMLILGLRLTSAIGALARDEGAERALPRRITEVVALSVMMTVGLVIWCMPTASLIGVRDGDYDAGGAVLAFAGSVQLLWMIVAVLVLPYGRSAWRRGGFDDFLPADGSVPASAKATRIVLPSIELPAQRPVADASHAIPLGATADPARHPGRDPQV